jgi:hypothetical protein
MLAGGMSRKRAEGFGDRRLRVPTSVGFLVQRNSLPEGGALNACKLRTPHIGQHSRNPSFIVFVLQVKMMR